MNDNAVNLLQMVAEDLRAADSITYAAVAQALKQGARLQTQITFGSEPALALGFTDDYNRTRWVHTMPLQ